jgi:toxin ParE1/3/4
MARAKRGYQAELDAIEIWVHVARRDAGAADRLVDRLTESIERLAAQPMLGRSADHLLPGLRSLPVGDYLIFYRPDDEGVSVVRIIHGARQITPELFE